jgi:hypothetical protein
MDKLPFNYLAGDERIVINDIMFTEKGLLILTSDSLDIVPDIREE